MKIRTYEEAVAAAKAKEQEELKTIIKFNEHILDIESIFTELVDDYGFISGNFKYKETEYIESYWVQSFDVTITEDLLLAIDRIKKKLVVGHISIVSPLMKRKAEYNNSRNIYKYTKGNRELLHSCVGGTDSLQIIVSV